LGKRSGVVELGFFNLQKSGGESSEAGGSQFAKGKAVALETRSKRPRPPKYALTLPVKNRDPLYPNKSGIPHQKLRSREGENSGKEALTRSDTSNKIPSRKFLNLIKPILERWRRSLDSREKGGENLSWSEKKNKGMPLTGGFRLPIMYSTSPS